MIVLFWPWLLLLLPMPFLVWRFAPQADPGDGGGLRVPFFRSIQGGYDSPGRRVGLPGSRLFRAAFLVWVLLVLSAARPVWIGDHSVLPTTGRDLMLLVDISGSMRAMDFTLHGVAADRLSVVKQVAGRFLENRVGDRVGLILFGAEPYMRAPLTRDVKVVRALLEESEVALAGEHTAIGDAIGLAVKRMRGLPSQTRVLVLLTDGANNRGRVTPEQSARLAAREGIRVYTVAVGASRSPAPNPYGVWSSAGAERFERVVLEDIAARTGGRFFHALDSEALEGVYRELDRLEPSLGDDWKAVAGTSLYPWSLGLALLLTAWLVFLRVRGTARA